MLRRQLIIRGMAISSMVGAAGALALAACGGAGQATGGAESGPPKTIGAVETSLQWQAELPQAALDNVETFLQPWYEKYPKVKIEPIALGGGDADKIQKVLTLAAAGTPIEVLGKITFMQPLARAGAVRELDTLIKRDKYDISGYNPNWLKTFGTLEGKLYSLPWGLGGNALAFIYSPAALAEVGLKPPSQDWKNPWTWDEYREYARRLTKKQGDTYIRAGADALGDYEYTPPMQFGAQWLADDGKTVTCDSPQMIEAYTRYTDIILKDRTSSLTPGVGFSGDNAAKFGNGQVALSFIGGWQMLTFTDPEKYKVDYAIATFPKGSYSSPDIDTIQLAVAKDIKSNEEAWAFVKWLLDGGRYANLVFRMPTLQKDAAAWAKDAFKKVPASARVDVLVDSLKVARGQDPVRAHVQVATIEKEAIGTFWQDVLAGKTTVRDGLAEAKRKIQGIIASS